MVNHKVITFDIFSLLNVRIVFLISAFVHLVVTAVVTLSIDTTVDEDPRVRAYYYVRWKLLTCWFNLITLAYLPARLYSDWKTKQGEGNSSIVTLLHQATDMVMTGLLFPVTMYACFSFWYMYTIDPTFLGPPRVFDYLPYWAQHSLHTISIFVVILDLMLTPRRRPTSLKPRIALLLSFLSIYGLMLLFSHLRGEIVYPIFARLTATQSVSIILLSVVIMFMFFVLQWVAIDLLWSTSPKRKKI